MKINPLIGILLLAFLGDAHTVAAQEEIPGCGGKSDCAGASGPTVTVVVNTGGGKCLDVSPPVRTNGARVRVWSCNGRPQQKWRFDGASIINQASGKCLDVDAPHIRDDGAVVQVWDCNNTPAQQWRRNGAAIVNSKGKCLDVDAPNMNSDGGIVQVWECNGEPQQHWQTR